MHNVKKYGDKIIEITHMQSNLWKWSQCWGNSTRDWEIEFNKIPLSDYVNYVKMNPADKKKEIQMSDKRKF